MHAATMNSKRLQAWSSSDSIIPGQSWELVVLYVDRHNVAGNLSKRDEEANVITPLLASGHAKTLLPESGVLPREMIRVNVELELVVLLKSRSKEYLPS